MSELEKAIELLKQEGFSENDVVVALNKIKSETTKQPVIQGSLDEYLNSLDDITDYTN